LVLSVGVWVASRGQGRSGGSGGYAVWILVPFILLICGVGVWLVVQAIRFTGFDLMR
jgi:hypothetical protein